MLAIVRGRGSNLARLRIAQGVLVALGFSVAGSLLKIVALHTWVQIRSFTVVFLLRTVLKKVFAWEEQGIERRLGGGLSTNRSGSGGVGRAQG